MYGIDFQNQLNDFLLDEKRKISKDHLNNVCKIYKKHETCRYLSLSKIGFVCMKISPAKNKLDQLVREKSMVARGDNCKGLGENK